LGTEYNHLVAPGTKAVTPPSVLGCALSHYLVVKEFLEGTADTCLILEDDARLAPKCVDNLTRILDAAPPGWDMIKLASFPEYTGPDILVRRTVSLNYVARVVSRAGAAKLVAKRIAWPSHADVTNWFVPNMRIYVASNRFPTFHQNCKTCKTSGNSGNRYPRYDMNLKIVRVGSWEVLTGDVLVALVVLVGWTVFCRKRKSRK
jgi:GR25 family glycosyltransferase involved in LPS biosynthesis